MTIGQLNAIGSAKSYLDFSAFSKSGLIDQLIYEGYSKTDAAFAVSNITVDWNEQAAKSAQSYLDFSSFSRQGLIDQLLYEGFTTGQAASGVAAVGF
ncbi:Ltp family lipoprotein [Ilumatobacter sp.]